MLQSRVGHDQTRLFLLSTKLYSFSIMLRIVIVILPLFLLACQTKTNQQTSVTAPVADSASVLATRPGPNAPRSAADRLVRALYFEHSKQENPLLETKDRALIDQFFAKSTADLIWRNVSTPAAKLKQTRTNPLFGAPNEAVKKMWVLPAAVAGSRAVVYVTFENKAKAQEIRVDLQQAAGRWRIVDMRYPDGRRLTQLLQ